MKKLIYFSFVVAVFAFACKSENTVVKQVESTKYGGTLRINENTALNTLYPPAAKDLTSTHIISQLYEGLVKYDPNNLSILPAIAHNWDIDSTGKVYTFYLKFETVCQGLLWL